MAHPNDPRVDEHTVSHHLGLLEQATRNDLDELLTELLCHVYTTLVAQNG